MKKKQRHQVKSRFYYLFWGAATVSVFAGQLYVGTGYRKMSESFERILKTPIVVGITGLPSLRKDSWDNYQQHEPEFYHPTDPPKRIY